MAKKFNLQAGAEAEAFALTDFDQPRSAGGECFCVDALGHEKELIGRKLRGS